MYGLASVFQAAKDQRLQVPGTVDELREALREHLYVEGGPDNIRLDEHTLRVVTDDDEVALAYLFFDEAEAIAHPGRVAYLLHDAWPLPRGREAPSAPLRPFQEPDVVPLEPAGSRSGSAYLCLLTFYDGASLDIVGPYKLAGVTVGGLVDYLRETAPRAEPVAWPFELRLLRAMIEPGDTTLEPALRRCAAYPVGAVGAEGHRHLGLGGQGDARRDFERATGGRPPGGDPAASLIDVSPHLAQMAMHASHDFGYQQWFLFDDAWASAHPELAESLLRYTWSWDPWAPEEAPRPAGMEVAWRAVVWSDDGEKRTEVGVQVVPTVEVGEARRVALDAALNRLGGSSRTVSLCTEIAGTPPEWEVHMPPLPDGLPGSEAVRRWRAEGRTSAQIAESLRSDAGVSALSIMRAFVEAFGLRLDDLSPISAWAAGRVTAAELDAQIDPAVLRVVERAGRPARLVASIRDGASAVALVRADLQGGATTIDLLHGLRHAFSLDLRAAKDALARASAPADAALDDAVDALLRARVT